MDRCIKTTNMIDYSLEGGFRIVQIAGSEAVASKIFHVGKVDGSDRTTSGERDPDETCFILGAQIAFDPANTLAKNLGAEADDPVDVSAALSSGNRSGASASRFSVVHRSIMQIANHTQNWGWN